MAIFKVSLLPTIEDPVGLVSISSFEVFLDMPPGSQPGISGGLSSSRPPGQLGESVSENKKLKRKAGDR